jgi:hypothetical protein
MAVAATLFLAFAGILSYQLYQSSVKPEAIILGQQKNGVPQQGDSLVNQIDPQYGKLVAQFTTVIETKQEQLKKLEKDDPELYKKFAGDILKLDSAYHSLRKYA